MENKTKTETVTVAKSTIGELTDQKQLLAKETVIDTLLNSMPYYILILNMNREIVFANRSFLSALGHQDIDQVLGKRPGEALNCLHASESGFECGSTQYCDLCGASLAIKESENSKSSVKECRISVANAEAYDFHVWANPLFINDQQFSIFAVVDTSNEQRRKALERIFFHDILNLAWGLKNFMGLLYNPSVEEKEEIYKMAYELTEKLIEEIQAQQELSKAENNELNMLPKPFSTLTILQEIKSIYLSHHVIDGKNIVIDDSTCDEIMITDKGTLRRVLGNLLKNALEASGQGDTVTLKCCSKSSEDKYIFSVHNTSFIPKDISLQIFKRSFSTKESSRGLGTYSVRLLSERYLKGSVYFESDIKEGTTFYATYPKKII